MAKKSDPNDDGSEDQSRNRVSLGPVVSGRLALRAYAWVLTASYATSQKYDCALYATITQSVQALDPDLSMRCA